MLDSIKLSNLTSTLIEKDTELDNLSRRMIDCCDDYIKLLCNVIGYNVEDRCDGITVEDNDIVIVSFKIMNLRIDTIKNNICCELVNGESYNILDFNNLKFAATSECTKILDDNGDNVLKSAKEYNTLYNKLKPWNSLRSVRDYDIDIIDL